MTDINSVVSVVVNIKDVRITRAGFGTPLLYGLVATVDLVSGALYSERVRTYGSIDDVAVDFKTTSKFYLAAAAIFSQTRTPETIKIGAEITADSSTDATALNAIKSYDNGWYCLISVTARTKARYEAIAAWTLTQAKIVLMSSEDAEILDPADLDDLAIYLKGLNNNRAAVVYHHKSGFDITSGATTVITSEIATVTKTAHGARVGDPIVAFGNAQTQANGIHTILSVPTANTFTYEAAGAADDASADAMTFYVRYTFPEAAWSGLMLPTDPGSETWKFKSLSGIEATPLYLLSSTAEAAVLAKYGNLYTPLVGIGITHDGTMASGRFIDIQRSADWLEARIGEAILLRLVNSEKLPYTDEGAAVLRAEIAGVLERGIRAGMLGPLLDNSGDFYRITIPKVSSQDPADRAARNFVGISAIAQMAGAIHRVEITVNASV